MLSFLSLSTGLSEILPVCIHDLHHLHKIYKKYVMSFIIRILKAPNLAENQTNLTEKLFKKFGSADQIEPAFCKSDFPHPLHPVGDL